MITRVMIQSERTESYDGKKGHVSEVRIACQDMCASGKRLLNTFDYTLTDDEKELFAGKLQDKFAEIAVNDFVVFGGRLRARGSIVKVDGLQPKQPNPVKP